MTLNNKFYFLSPVEVVKVTPKNLEEVAQWCGGKVARTESRHMKGRVDSYVQVPTPKGAAISWAFPGMFITKRLAVTEKDELKGTFSVFRKDYFTKNYFADVSEAVDKTWERQEQEKKGREAMEKAMERGSITINISGASSPDEVTALVQEALSTGEIEHEIGFARPEIPLAAGDIMDPFQVIEESEFSLPDSPVEQRVAIHEDAVEAEAESA